MKKARTITIDKEKTHNKKEYNRLKEHAYNSSLWYVTNYNYNSHKLKEKLQQKGYTIEAIKVKDENNNISKHNIIEEVIEELKNKLVLDEKEQAKRIIQAKRNQGIGDTHIKQQLQRKGYSAETIDEAMEECVTHTNEMGTSEAIEKARRKIINGSTYKSKEGIKQKQYMLQTLVRKGFTMEEIKEHEQLLEDSEE